MKDYYSILGVPIDADTSLIKSVYKSLCKIYHPDTYVGNKTYADKKIKEINEAYEHLKNPEKRKKYDTEFQNNYSENSENNSHNHKKNNENDFEKSIKPDWEILVNYFPEIELERLYLKKLDLNLSTNFQIILISLDNPENLD